MSTNKFMNTTIIYIYSYKTSPVVVRCRSLDGMHARTPHNSSTFFTRARAQRPRGLIYDNKHPQFDRVEYEFGCGAMRGLFCGHIKQEKKKVVEVEEQRTAPKTPSTVASSSLVAQRAKVCAHVLWSSSSTSSSSSSCSS